MATELSASELFLDDILWFLRAMDHETIDEVDRLISQIEENVDMQLLNSTPHVDSASTISNKFANVDSVELKRLYDINFSTIRSAQLISGSIDLNHGEYPEKCRLEVGRYSAVEL